MRQVALESISALFHLRQSFHNLCPLGSWQLTTDYRDLFFSSQILPESATEEFVFKAYGNALLLTKPGEPKQALQSLSRKMAMASYGQR